jgi:hypothetical protein
MIAVRGGGSRPGSRGFPHEQRDPYASLDKVEPLLDLADDERARPHASLRQAEDEIAAGKAVAAEDLARELRAAR